MTKTTDKSGKGKGVSRRNFLKGSAAVTAGAALGSGAITGFPTIWAQNIKDVTLTHVGSIYTTNPTVAAQAAEDLGFKVAMQTLGNTDMINRMLTQPTSIDICDMGNTAMGITRARTC